MKVLMIHSIRSLARNLANFSYTKVIVTVTAYTAYSATGSRSDYQSPDFCLDATNSGTKDSIPYDSWTINQVGWKNYAVTLTQTYTYNGNWPHMGFNMSYAGNAVTISKIVLA